MRRIVVTAVLLLALLSPLTTAMGSRDGEPEQVVVQHMLIAFKHSVRGKEISRSRKEARALAESLMSRIEAGEDFDALVQEYTDDKYPGIMLLTNEGAKPQPNATPRSGVVIRFGDVAFRLEVGQVELADYHASLSPYGWHIIKRLE